MLSVGAMAGGQGGYYTSLAREDYYTEGGEPVGLWLGKGAEKLGLSGAVAKETFLELFNGFQDGERLVQNAGKDNHRPGWDLTFSAPKSVSVLWSQVDQETALEIRAAHLSAVEKAVGYLEQEALWTRRGKGGLEHERCEAVVAAFEHGTSRAQEPQLHTHALLLNIGLTQDGKTRSLETQAIYEHKMAAGAIYRAELSHQLERRLGVEIVRERSWFEVKGVSKALIEEFSTRRHEIEKALAAKGVSSSRAAEVAALDTRTTKAHIPREELIARWGAVGEEKGWGREAAIALVKGRQPAVDHGKELERAAEEAMAKLMDRQAFFTTRELTRVVAEAAQGIGGGADAALAATKKHLETSAEIVRLGLRFKEAAFTTQEMLRLEKDLLSRVQTAAKTPWNMVQHEHLNEAIHARKTITEEQAAAVRHIVRDTGGIACVSGMAGTGKTFMLAATREAFEKSGHRVIGACLSGKAARGLQEGAGIQSATIAKTLKDLDLALLRVERSPIAPNAPSWSPLSGASLPHLSFRKGKDPVALDSNTVLVIDEAGMVGTRQMQALMAAAQRARAKVVLVGDEKQLQPIEAGAPFAAISKNLGSAKLTDIVRQNEEWQRQTVKDLAAGDSGKALAEYARRGLVEVAKDRDNARAKLLETWTKVGISKPEENLIVTGTNLDASLLNKSIQAIRLAEGYVKQAHAKVGGEQMHEGDRVVFTRNSTALGVNNGTLGTIQTLDRIRGEVSVRLDGGEERKFSLAAYAHLKLGYAFTTHTAQGMTAENVFVLTHESMQDLHLSYVQASRPRAEIHFYTTEAEAGSQLTDLARTMAREHQKLMAVEVAKQAEQQERERSARRQDLEIGHEQGF